MSLAQQKRLYEAEKVLWNHGKIFSNINEVATYLTFLTATQEFIKWFGFIPSITIERASLSGKWAGAADRKTWTIYLKSLRENVILHELAHLLSPTDEHDDVFVSRYQHLIRTTMGFNAWAEFNWQLKEVEYYNV